MIHRNGRPGDFHSGKWNGLGGKCEADESPQEAASREFGEEAGLKLPSSRFKPLSVTTYPRFKPHKDEDWIVFTFFVELAHAEVLDILKSCDEGDLHWIAPADLPSLNLWSGDKHFMPLVSRGEPFVGTLWYDNGECVRHWLQRL